MVQKGRGLGREVCATSTFFLASAGEIFEQRVGCFRAVSNPSENVGASSGSPFLKARIVLPV
jgi:hypothetical protein